MTDTAGTPRTRALASAIRQVLDDSEPSLRTIAKGMGISHTTLSQWAHAKRVPKAEDVATLLGALGVTGAERNRILELAHNASDPNWLTTGIPGISQQLAGVMECERTAKTIIDWSPALMPGLLQTGGYARLVLGGGPATPADLETRITLRVGRAEAIHRVDPVHLIALIGEAAVKNPIGSDDEHQHQLHHLLKMAGLPNVSIRLVPSGIGWHPGLMGPFIKFDFPQDPAIVHLEHHRSGVFLYDEADVEAYAVAADQIRALALSEEDTASTIAKLVN
ncbi:helix-turn-helix domain-containing protein [Umezawaea endophytica]|uniref:Helix-turn-helix transcriptional regulator n=1 Tax=Umezawaea endophytica TaxID=1654476 RepID=A0A9X3AFE9_9PSEU|nr:helix-turn-helix transcriptional regulator [Umezawaea endophytica]MCS7478171.1 helix-turn-helix transcriptional regulator [Umezawaea endophytica]